MNAKDRIIYTDANGRVIVEEKPMSLYDVR